MLYIFCLNGNTQKERESEYMNYQTFRGNSCTPTSFSGYDRKPLRSLLGTNPWQGFFDAVSPAVNQLPFRVDVYENPESYEIAAELAGIPKGDINIRFEDEALVIEATFRRDSNGKAESQKYSRAVRFAGNVNVDQVRATYKHGILTVSLPKADEVKSREITIS
jgi:HSP20 family protein